MPLSSGESAFINTQAEEGSWQTPTVVSTLVDTDKDGMPDTWKMLWVLTRMTPLTLVLL